MQLVKFIFSKVFVINLIIAIGVVISAFFLVSSYLTSYTLHGESIEVPTFENYQVHQLEDVFNRANLTYVINDSIYIKGKAPGTVIDQSPSPGYLVKKGRKVYLTITSINPPKTSLPNLIDRSMRQAEAMLSAYGLKLGELTYAADPCSNCVLKQQINGEDVPPGTPIEKGATVDLVLGKGLGDEMVEIPYLYRLSIEDAKVNLRVNLLTLGYIEYDETVVTAEDSSNAIVYRQIPPYTEGKSINAGSLVNLFLTMDENKVTDYAVDTTETIIP
jgi:beta-lactam-binding protein with PASTA domain